MMELVLESLKMGPLLFALCLVAGAAARQPVALPWDNYHESVGIPLASRIKDAEDGWMSGDSFGSRIVGGAAAPLNGHPYLVRFVYF